VLLGFPSVGGSKFCPCVDGPEFCLLFCLLSPLLGTMHLKSTHPLSSLAGSSSDSVDTGDKTCLPRSCPA
jgi:hypothetical protein